MSFGSVKSGSKVELPPQKVDFIKSMPVARIQDFLAAFKAQKKANDPDQEAFTDIREIMKMPLQQQSSMDISQMFAYVDRHMNDVHNINVEQQCKSEEEKLAFHEMMSKMHEQITVARERNNRYAYRKLIKK